MGSFVAIKLMGIDKREPDLWLSAELEVQVDFYVEMGSLISKMFQNIEPFKIC